MLIHDVDLASSEMLVYMERYVNDGSPSGFTAIHGTSLRTSPQEGEAAFSLPIVELDESVLHETFGSWPVKLERWGFPIHPDMVPRVLQCAGVRGVIDGPSVAPTASARTVKITGGNGWYVKLAYRGLLGRTNRQLSRRQASSAVEVTELIERAMKAGRLAPPFHFLRERFGEVVHLADDDGIYEWGYVLRDPTPYPPNDAIVTLIPGFSLFSRDVCNPTHPSILVQLIETQTLPAATFLFDKLLRPLIDTYFSVLLTYGLQLEAHAQNILFALDRSLQPVGIVARDAESIDKDLSLMEELGLTTELRLKSIDWKCLRRHQYNYQIMHSFMYDFKLGDYLVTPIIAEAARNFEIDVPALESRIAHRAASFVQHLPSDFFPDRQWFSYASIVHEPGKRRPYIATPNPRYR